MKPDNFYDLGNAELDRVVVSARQRRDGTWEALLITESDERWGCDEKHSTMREAVACGHHLLAMLRGEA